MQSSELIIKDDGSIYHLGLKPEDLADTIITVGDPNRVDLVTKYFDTIYYKKEIREFVSVKGSYNGLDILVISTGIGTDNIDIVINELDALANINFNTRKVSEQFRKLSFFRIGTSGALVDDIPLGSLLVSAAGIGLDSLMHFYSYQKSQDSISLFNELKSQFASLLPEVSFYSELGDERLVKEFKAAGFYTGITVTAPGFYGPQGRSLRLNLAYDDYLNKVREISTENLRVTNLEMETAGIYALCAALGHEAVSLNAILANRFTGEFCDNSSQVVDELIRKSLDVIGNIS